MKFVCFISSIPIRKGRRDGITLLTHSKNPLCALSKEAFENTTSSIRKMSIKRGNKYRFNLSTLNSVFDTGKIINTKHRSIKNTKYIIASPNKCI